MDVLLLGSAAIVLIGITVWIVWPTPSADVTTKEAPRMIPQGDAFEDQYTSATADLSAGAVAATLFSVEEDAEPAETVATQPSAGLKATEPAPSGTDSAMAGEAWSQPTLSAERTLPALPPPSEPPREWGVRQPATIGIGAAVLLTLAGALAGAFLYARWQRRRNTPLNRVKRRLLR